MKIGERMLRVPTLEEITRVKVWLCLMRNATRDYVDFAALAHRLGPLPVAAPEAMPRPALAIEARPNPFNPTTLLRYRIAESGPVSIAVYDARGRRAQWLVHGGHHEPGSYDLPYRARGGCGVWYVRIESAGNTVTLPITVVE